MKLEKVAINSNISPPREGHLLRYLFFISNHCHLFYQSYVHMAHSNLSTTLAALVHIITQMSGLTEPRIWKDFKQSSMLITSALDS